MHDTSEKKRILNEEYFSQMEEIVASMQQFTFGNSVSVLMITETLDGYAKGLELYLSKSTDIAVDLIVNDSTHIHDILDEKPFDFLLIVGHLENNEILDAVSIFDFFNEYSPMIICTYTDDIIAPIDNEFELKYAFNLSSSIYNLIPYMRRVYDNATQAMYQAHSHTTTRRDTWLNSTVEMETHSKSPILVYWGVVHFFKKFIKWLLG